MKKQTQTRFLTLLLALCLMITSLVLPTFADEGASSATDSIGVGASPGENATVTGAECAKSAEEAKLRYLAERTNHVPTRSLDDVISDGGSSFASAEAIELDVYYTVAIETFDEYKYFSIELETEGFFTFESSSLDYGDPHVRLCNSEEEELEFNDDFGSLNFALTYYLLPFTTYYFKIGNVSEHNDCLFDVRLTSVTSADSLNTTTISIGSTYDIDTDVACSMKYFKFVPTHTMQYLFFSSNYAEGGNPEIYLYNSSLTYINSNGGILKDNNFRLVITLNAGQTYYIAARNYDNGYGAYTLNTYWSASVPTDIYCIKNIGTQKYVEIQDHDEPDLISQTIFSGSSDEQWTIQRLSDGYYTIRSNYEGNKYIGVSNLLTNSNNIKLYSSIADNTKWNIFCLDDGTLLFEPKMLPGYVLYSVNSTDGTALRLKNMSAAVSGRNQWIFAIKSNTTLEGQQTGYWCWAASARMLTNHYYNVPAERTQSLAVEGVFGFVQTTARGTALDAIMASSIYRSGNKDDNELNLIRNNGKRLSENSLRRFLNDGHVIYIGRGRYNLNNQRISGHATVIVGYSTTFNAGQLNCSYIIFDPWPQNETNAWTTIETRMGQAYNRSYQWICNGNHEVSGEESDDGIWDKFIVVAPDYSYELLDPDWN